MYHKEDKVRFISSPCPKATEFFLAYSLKPGRQDCLQLGSRWWKSCTRVADRFGDQTQTSNAGIERVIWSLSVGNLIRPKQLLFRIQISKIAKARYFCVML